MDLDHQSAPDFTIKIGHTIHLSEYDIMRIWEMTEAKCKAKEMYDIDQSNIGYAGSAFDKEKLSIGSEFAAARALGLPDLDEGDAVNNRKYDFKLCDQTVDVKATNHRDGGLFVRPDKQFYCDWFLLYIRIDLRTFKFAGSASKAQLVSQQTLSQPPGFKGLVHYLNQKQLKDFSI